MIRFQIIGIREIWLRARLTFAQARETFCETMKTASVRELRQDFPRIMAWIEDGEQVAVTMRRKVIARLIPEKPVPLQPPDFQKRFGKPDPARGKLANSVVNLLSQDRGT